MNYLAIVVINDEYFEDIRRRKINSFMTKVLIIRNQSIDMQSKSMDWFLYEKGLRHEKAKYTKIGSDNSIFVSGKDIDNNNLNFEDQIFVFCQKANNESSANTKIQDELACNKKKLDKQFALFQFYSKSVKHYHCFRISSSDYERTFNSFMTEGSLSYRNHSPMICRELAYQWTGFYMIRISVMKQLTN